MYDNARTEKMARGAAYSRARRALGKDSFVILDGMNYIKGFRYQLWCEAKAAGTGCCVVSFYCCGGGSGEQLADNTRFTLGLRLIDVSRITRLD